MQRGKKKYKKKRRVLRSVAVHVIWTDNANPHTPICIPTPHCGITTSSTALHSDSFALYQLLPLLYHRSLCSSLTITMKVRVRVRVWRQQFLSLSFTHCPLWINAKGEEPSLSFFFLSLRLPSSLTTIQ